MQPRENLLDLPRDRVCLRGQRIRLSRVLHLHASELSAYPDAQVAVPQEAYCPSEPTKDVVRKLATVTSALAGMSSSAAKWAVATGAMARNLDRPRRVVIVGVRDLMEGD